MPTPETDAIEPNERFIRLIWCQYFKTGVPSQSGFKPRDNEHTGISLFRESCLDHPLDCLRVILTVEKRDFYAVVSYPLNAFKSRQMSFVRDKVPDAPGHVLLAEITPNSWKENENNLQYRISELAKDEERILIRSPVKTDYPGQK